MLKQRHQRGRLMTEEEMVRRELWSRVYAATVEAGINPASGTLWADLALKDYDERFGSQPIPRDPK